MQFVVLSATEVDGGEL